MAVWRVRPLSCLLICIMAIAWRDSEATKRPTVADYFHKIPGKYLPNKAFKTKEQRNGISKIQCAMECQKNTHCMSFNIRSDNAVCELNSDADFTPAKLSLLNDEASQHYMKVPHDCADYNGIDDVHNIYISSMNRQLRVSCEEGWTVLMRRTGPELNFNRSWVEYRDGFGDVAGDHWLGLEAFHHLTNQGNYSLMTEVRDALNDSYFWDIHANFLIGTEDQQYTLKLKLNGVGNLSSNSTIDPWEKNVNMKFSTHDQKNDNKLTCNCAAENGGGWWFHKCGDISFTSFLATECVPSCWKAARHAGIPFGVRGSAEKLLRWAVMKIKRSEDL